MGPFFILVCLGYDIIDICKYMKINTSTSTSILILITNYVKFKEFIDLSILYVSK